ncbi:glycosyltransferase family 4 protein [Candidatus Pacearchaeota archaeon]|nr:glycosyltransferase family 4 protein [Candidatus Pacearchaeota archaeon]
MKVGFLLISHGGGGAENATFELINSIAQNKGIKIIVYINDEIFDKFKALPSIDVVNLGKFPSSGKAKVFLSTLNFSRKLSKHLKKDNLDLLQICLQNAMAISNWIRHPPPLILRFAGTELETLDKPKKNILEKYLAKNTRLSMKSAKILVALSNDQLGLIPRKYHFKVNVIPNGVNLDFFKCLEGVKQKKNVILFVGRYIGIKGINEILAVASQLPQYDFWFVGEGPLNYLINLPNTVDLGFKTKKDLAVLYNQATFCVFPSYREGFSNVGLEATSCGRSLICTSQGFSGYIEDGKDGIIIPARNKDALKKAVINLMKNKGRRKMLEKNARIKAEAYSLDKISKKYLEVFKGAIKK